MKSDPAQRLASWGFTGRPFQYDDMAHTVFEKGAGKPVLVMHELPGLAQPAVNFAQRLVDAGFQVHLPHLFGNLLEYAPLGNLRRLCISREFARLKAGVSSPITLWLRALASDICSRTPASRIGAIGMCVTGAFVIPLVLNPVVRAAIAAQPAVPFRLGYRLTGLGRGEWMQQLNVSDDDLKRSAQHARQQDVRLMALRFHADRVCPAERLARIKSAYGEQIEVHEYAFPGKLREVFSPPHATLTDEYDKAKTAGPTHPTREAFARVCEFLHAQL